MLYCKVSSCNAFISKGVTASVVADSIAVYILLSSIPSTCDASWHLKAWLLGCLLLSWPATAISASISERNFRHGFCAELVLLTCSMIWLMISWRFWPIFVSSIFVWSILIFTMSCLVICTILVIFLGKKNPHT
eukprot:g29369.t1